MKKVLSLLCVALLLATQVSFAQAESVTESEPAETQTQGPVTEPDEALMKEAETLYRRCLYSAGVDSFHGKCGLSTSYQLWRLGINEDCLVYDGNKQFDAYRYMDVTSGGYEIRAYSVEEYSMKEALSLLSQDGTRTVKNILVGFQRTNAEAGSYYGHACLINAIQNGIVYFNESFGLALGRREGKVITCSIDEFVEFYADWTTYEGLIYFGEKQYAQTCQSYRTDEYVQLRFDSSLRSQPCLLGQNECGCLRDLSAGELLHATGVYVNHEGDLFYRVDEGGCAGYVSVNAVSAQHRNAKAAALTDGELPTGLKAGDVLQVNGVVTAEAYPLSSVILELQDTEGTTLIREQLEATEGVCDLAQMNEALEDQAVSAGKYTLRLLAEVTYPNVEDGVLEMETGVWALTEQTLSVGVETAENSAPEESRDGWFLENSTWYCYEKGKPCTGWTERLGVTYYLQEDGAVTTGWTEIEGITYYFSDTGALSDGWFTTPEGTYYWILGAEMATGHAEFDGKQYYFSEDGKLLTGGQVLINDTYYNVRRDGALIPTE